MDSQIPEHQSPESVGAAFYLVVICWMRTNSNRARIGPTSLVAGWLQASPNLPASCWFTIAGWRTSKHWA